MRTSLIVFSALLYSCYSTPTIEGFDPEEWNQEINCESNRLGSARLLLTHEEELLALNQNEITALLGKPDEHELYDRNQKFFYFNLTEKCDSLPIQRLSFRFDALGRVNEINIYQMTD